ncbi:GSCOCG00006127001-RA-CDS [Cotesia congregata]|uniref:Small ribosomal subunit protein uS15m n=1 Tax=Cotesia congregata TaxID=51543 RepID=A0A8J2HID0_COTCN|nr:GSCOCG00006127001-RA-CDS [Cotesia congregata]CAG5100249.1 Similar to bonsai: 28S ribosomal protein S15 [Cotesia congregata]
MSIILNTIRPVSNLIKHVPIKIVPARLVVTFKSDFKIEWTRPEKVPATHPSKSCDMGLERTTKSDELYRWYNQSKELQDADDIVKRLCTLEFLPKKMTENMNRERTIALVKRHELDRGSPEAEIAAMTSEILYLQEYLTERPRDKKTKVFLKELIDKRRKLLGRLRKWDYRRFEWVLEKMNLKFKPHPPEYHRVERKASIRKLTTIRCDKIISTKLEKYREELNVQKKIFFNEKADKLAFIRAEEIACGQPPSVTEEEIAEAREQAKQYQ